jgi:DNA-binding LytR/AlgR family response regulator
MRSDGCLFVKVVVHSSDSMIPETTLYFWWFNPAHFMKSYRVALLEDNPDDQQILLEFIGQTPFLKLVGSFDNPIIALPFLSTQRVDLLLLDLYLPGLSGFDVLRSLPRPPAVIMTTVSLADSLEAFDVGAVDYLVKPIRYERFLRAVNRVLARNIPQEPKAGKNPVSQPFVSLKQGHVQVRVFLNEVAYIEAFGAYARVHLKDGQILLVGHLLNDLETLLPSPQFVRVHRSFLVASDQILRIANRQITLDNLTIPVGRTYQATLRQVLRERGGR